MLHFSEIRNPSPLVQGRASLMWAIKLDETETSISYKVTPFGATFGHRDKDKRVVVFDLASERVACLSLETGSICEANADFVPGQPDKPKMPRLCSHVYAAYQRLEKLIERRQERAA